MSPNPDAAEEELPFSEGQIIKVRPRKAQIHAVLLSLAEINGMATDANLLKSDFFADGVSLSPPPQGSWGQRSRWVLQGRVRWSPGLCAVQHGV